MNITNILQWVFIAMSLVPAIYFWFRPRELRRMFQVRVKFIRHEKVENGKIEAKNYFGYIVSWHAQFNPKEEMGETMDENGKKSRIRVTNLYHRTFVVVEPERSHHETGYIPQFVETTLITFL